MEWLDTHNGAVQAVATVIQVLVTVVLVGITIYYAVQTRRQVTAARDALAAQFRPMLLPVENVDANLIVPEERDQAPHPFQLVIENWGAGPALNVVAQVIRKGNPPNINSLVLQYGQTHIGIIAKGARAAPRVRLGVGFGFVGASSAGISDELTLEYESLDGRWYQTIAVRRAGRWWEQHQRQLSTASSRELDKNALRAQGIVV